MNFDLLLEFFHASNLFLERQIAKARLFQPFWLLSEGCYAVMLVQSHQVHVPGTLLAKLVLSTTAIDKYLIHNCIKSSSQAQLVLFASEGK